MTSSASSSQLLRPARADAPGIRRIRRGRGFSYQGASGKTLTGKRTLARIKRLGIPPAWREVWICTDFKGHIQATGIDDAGRKQYIYHPEWIRQQETIKFTRLISFAKALPAARHHMDQALAYRKLDRETVLGSMLAIMDRTCIRVGSEQYAAENDTYGIATLRSKHLSVRGDTLVFEYVGKAGVEHSDTISDRRLAKLVAEIDELPGYEVFKYYDEDGSVVDVKSEDINAFIKQVMGDDFSAKDFRTWTATVATAAGLFAKAYREQAEESNTEKVQERRVTEVVKQTADILGNTPAVCRSSYIDPRVIEHYLSGEELPIPDDIDGLSQVEASVLALLEAAEKKRANE